MSYNVLGDIAGNFKTMMALINKMPKGKIIAVGDIIDRGPNSKEVIEYFINNKETTEVLYGNHEDMMIDKIKNLRQYTSTCWFQNGGLETLKSFKGKISKPIVKFLESRKISLNLDIAGKTYYISHAFKPKFMSHDLVEENINNNKIKLIWAREKPYFDENSADIQIAGHNSQFGLKYWHDNKTDKQAICLDSSRNRVLTGINLPTMDLFQQGYID